MTGAAEHLQRGIPQQLSNLLASQLAFLMLSIRDKGMACESQVGTES
jgi:hypothetical protein